MYIIVNQAFAPSSLLFVKFYLILMNEIKKKKLLIVMQIGWNISFDHCFDFNNSTVVKFLFVHSLYNLTRSFDTFFFSTKKYDRLVKTTRGARETRTG